MSKIKCGAERPKDRERCGGLPISRPCCRRRSRSHRSASLRRATSASSTEPRAEPPCPSAPQTADRHSSSRGWSREVPRAQRDVFVLHFHPPLPNIQRSAPCAVRSDCSRRSFRRRRNRRSSTHRRRPLDASPAAKSSCAFSARYSNRPSIAATRRPEVQHLPSQPSHLSSGPCQPASPSRKCRHANASSSVTTECAPQSTREVKSTSHRSGRRLECSNRCLRLYWSSAPCCRPPSRTYPPHHVAAAGCAALLKKAGRGGLSLTPASCADIVAGHSSPL